MCVYTQHLSSSVSVAKHPYLPKKWLLFISISTQYLNCVTVTHSLFSAFSSLELCLPCGLIFIFLFYTSLIVLRTQIGISVGSNCRDSIPWINIYFSLVDNYQIAPDMVMLFCIPLRVHKILRCFTSLQTVCLEMLKEPFC